MKLSVYIITKPLQYINATNIPNDSKKICLLIDSFAKSKELLERAKKLSDFWDDLYWFKDRKKAYLYILSNRRKIEKIYTDSDMGGVSRFYLTLVYPIKIILYEEGFGNYRSEIRVKHNNYKRIFNYFDQLTGGNYLGGFYRTKEIFLYHPHAFYKLVDSNPQKKITQFKNKFYDHLITLREMMNLLPVNLSSEINQKKVIVYLTARKIEGNIFTVIDSYQDYYMILKPHPEFKFDTGIDKYFNKVIDNEIPAELLIVNLLNSDIRELLVLHHGDTTLLNLDNINKFKELNISNNKKVVDSFNKIREVIKV